jgi:DNA-binding transcriptional LysR family regulator
MKRADLPALAIFAVVAARRSFRAAARELGISVSAVSHAINGLETSLGVRILSRTTRSVAVTDAGQRLLDQLEPALKAIEEAVEAATASQSRLTGNIRLSVPRSAAELVVVPIVTEFTRRHPEVTIEVIVADAFTDIVASGFDAGVRFGESLQQDMIAVRIGPAQRGVIVGSPAYFEGRRVPVTPSDLQDHVCIRRRFAGGGIYRWELEKDGEAVVVAVDGGLILNDDRLIADAALTGAGLAYVFEGQVKTKIAAGDLITVLDDWCPSFPGFFLYYPSRRLMRPTLRALVDFARAS